MHKFQNLFFNIDTVIKYKSFFNEVTNNFGYSDYILDNLASYISRNYKELEFFKLRETGDYYIEFKMYSHKSVNEKYIDKYLKVSKFVNIEFSSYLNKLIEEGIDIYK